MRPRSSSGSRGRTWRGRARSSRGRSRTTAPSSPRARPTRRASSASARSARTRARSSRRRAELFQELLRDRLELHVRGPLVDLADLGVAPELLYGVVLREAVASVQLE